MPIHVGADIRQVDDEEFKARVYEVMHHVFDVHRTLGRLFHEKIYQREIAFRVADARREVPVEVRFENFCKTYYLDLLIGGGVLFEMKAVESLADRHKRQLMHYLFLTDLPHGKLVNLRPERVDHRFVNNVMSADARRSFVVADDGWEEIETSRLKNGLVALLRDWGAGLDLDLYEEAAAHICGRPPDASCAEIGIQFGGHSLGVQHAIGGTRNSHPHHRPQGRSTRRLQSESLPPSRSHRPCAIQWINITQTQVQFTTVREKKIREKKITCPSSFPHFLFQGDDFSMHHEHACCGDGSLTTRMRRLRYHPAVRSLVRQTRLTPANLVLPLFIRPGRGGRQEIASMPGHFQMTPDLLAEEIRLVAGLGLGGVLLFGIPAEKDPMGSDATSNLGIIPQAIQVIKQTAPELLVITDVLFLRIYEPRPLRCAGRDRRAGGRRQRRHPGPCSASRPWPMPEPAPTWSHPAA